MYTYQRLFIKKPRVTTLKGNLTLSQGGIILSYDTETIAAWPNGFHQLLTTSPAVLFSPQPNQYAELAPAEEWKWLAYPTREPDTKCYFSGRIVLSSDHGFGLTEDECGSGLASWFRELGCKTTNRQIRGVQMWWFENLQPIELLSRPAGEIPN